MTLHIQDSFKFNSARTHVQGYRTLHKLTWHCTYRIAANSIVPELTCRDWVAHPPWVFWSSLLSKAWWWWRRKTCHELRILMPALVVECCLLPLSLGLAPLHPLCTSTLRCKPVHLAHGTVGWKPNPQRTAHLPLQTPQNEDGQSFCYAVQDHVFLEHSSKEFNISNKSAQLLTWWVINLQKELLEDTSTKYHLKTFGDKTCLLQSHMNLSYYIYIYIPQCHTSRIALPIPSTIPVRWYLSSHMISLGYIPFVSFK